MHYNFMIPELEQKKNHYGNLELVTSIVGLHLKAVLLYGIFRFLG